MSPSRSAVACAGAAGLTAALAVAQQRVGLALTVALLLVGAAGVLAARGRPSTKLATDGRPSIPLAILAGALAVQPVLRDAGWVVAVDVIALPIAVAAAVAVDRAETWRGVGSALVAPLRLLGGSALLARGARAAASGMPVGRLGPVARGVLLGAVLTLGFGALFVAADRAFADLVDRTLRLRLDAGELVWRALLGLSFVVVAGALAKAATRSAAPASRRTGRHAPGSIELRIALTAVIALFAAFVVVQLHVLFGGAAYVQRTTGLGYGEYARQGFVQLLAVAALTLAVIAVAARRPDRAVRALLGALCVLTLVVLVSAHHRLDLVEDAYGLTRVRYAGEAIVAWFALAFMALIAAGVRRDVAGRLPRIAMLVTLAGVLGFSLSDPDARIADSAVSRAASGRPVDASYLAGLSADALPALERLAGPQRRLVVAEIRARLARPDGLAGANLSRARAR